MCVCVCVGVCLGGGEVGVCVWGGCFWGVGVYVSVGGLMCVCVCGGGGGGGACRGGRGLCVRV